MQYEGSSIDPGSPSPRPGTLPGKKTPGILCSAVATPNRLLSFYPEPPQQKQVLVAPKEPTKSSVFGTGKSCSHCSVSFFA